MEGTALIITNGYFMLNDAKTAHGLVRGTERYKIAGVIDHKCAGKDAGEVLDGKHRDIPVFESLDQALKTLNYKVDFGIIGVATHGGYLPDELLKVVKSFLENGISIVNGLHDLVSNRIEMRELAEKNGCKIYDIRKPRTFNELHFWTGKIKEVVAPKIAVLGTECAIGKRTTARMLTQSTKKYGLKSEMIYTGQTGWLQGGKYGFIFDCTPNDFISGEIENAIYNCYKEANPDIIFVEGQSALRNPSGPCGSEFLLSGKMDGVILQHQPTRLYFDDEEEYGKLPEIEEEIALIKMYGVKTLAITLNTYGLAPNEIKEVQKEYAERTGIPVILPLQEGVDEITELLKKVFML
ncbi:MAG: hypothetical protein CMO01_20555 [Thalassobius sp.]|nr:hypothetical protein [Thalassovita sp.]